jgi:hypothetical protein
MKPVKAGEVMHARHEWCIRIRFDIIKDPRTSLEEMTEPKPKLQMLVSEE